MERDKIYIVLMLVPYFYGREYKLAWSRQYLAYNANDAKEQAKADFPDSIITDVERIKCLT